MNLGLESGGVHAAYDAPGLAEIAARIELSL